MRDEQEKPQSILLVDDEIHLLNSYSITLNEAGYDNVLLCADSREVMQIIAQNNVELVLLDLTMPHLAGTEILQQIHADYPQIAVTIITGNNDVETAVECMKRGAFDYLLKPIEPNRLINGVRRAKQMLDLQRENSVLRSGMLKKELHHPQAFQNIITQNQQMQAIFQYMEAISKSSEPVLITGETGVGKELIAKAFYQLSGLAGDFITVNVAGLDDQMFTDTLYGHTKGAFTDAVRARSGLIEKANDGLLFLDEIGDLSLASQVKLLRLLQEMEYYPLGSDNPRYTNARIVLATNKDLYQQQESGNFRKDLYYRLNVHNINIPSLSERIDDLPLLIEHFLEEAAEQMYKPKPTAPYELLTLLSGYHFPGNIRELRALLFDAVAAHKSGVMSLENVIQNLEKSNYLKSPQAEQKADVDSGLMRFSAVLPTLKESQKLLIKEAMKRTDGNQSIAARLLGITRQALNKRLKSIDL
ncbi:MAG: sigma-54 dependent transcriptional regulator [Candidatus Cloacimonadales bacterium]